MSGPLLCPPLSVSSPAAAAACCCCLLLLLAFAHTPQQHREYNPIFYDASQLDVTDEGTWWLSNQCRIPYTKFEGAAFPRILHYAR
jgi:hypothetical protein